MKKVKRRNGILAWHFHYGVLRHEEMPIEDGYVYGITGDTKPQLCSWGMHASIKILDAYKHVSGPKLSRVLLYGNVVEGIYKLAAQYREVLYTVDFVSIIEKFVDETIEKYVLKHTYYPIGQSNQVIKTKYELQSMFEKIHATFLSKEQAAILYMLRRKHPSDYHMKDFSIYVEDLMKGKDREYYEP